MRNKFIYEIYYEFFAATWHFADNPAKTMSAVDLAKFIVQQTLEYPHTTVEVFTDSYIQKYGEEKYEELECSSSNKFSSVLYKWIENKKYSFKKLADENGIYVNKEKLH